jgi:two-component system, cell cycle response regulator DivK
MSPHPARARRSTVESDSTAESAECACGITQRGLSFRTYFPVDPATPPASGAPLVLIVEDDLDTRVLYREFLSHSGFRTVDAHNGRQALAKARELGPDAVVTDLAVPGMDGFEFCRALKLSMTTRDIPILAVTGHTEYLDQPDRFAHAGIAQVLVKPCSPEVIAGALRRLLETGTASTRHR